MVMLGALGVMLGVELVRPRSRWPVARGWWVRVIAAVLAQVVLVYTVGLAVEPWMIRHRTWSADALGTVGGALVGIAAYTFVDYWWHRARHASPFLWRWLHQIHHSAERIELGTTYYLHPFEMISNWLLMSAVCYGALGLAPAAASLASFTLGLTSLFAHWNVRTPHWLGYVVQRPESHCLHHAAAAQDANFGDVPLWDMLFGTFGNPPSNVGDPDCGLGQGNESRVMEMLRGVDVTRPSL
jgi:sterol desaturase/sphingolipid hydroxylase (fatty acid hydroxylase superfamily)